MDITDGLKRMELSDREWMHPRLYKENRIGCEQNFGCSYLWQKPYDSTAMLYRDSVIVKSHYDGNHSYMLPTGDNIKEVLKDLISVETEKSNEFILNSLDDEQRELVERLFPGKFKFTEHRDSFDYVYSSTDLINLSGKKYHSKRNHISAFKREHEYEFVEINDDNLQLCIDMNKEWCKLNDCLDDDEMSIEACVTRRALRDYKELGFVGGFIKTADRGVVAFSLGEQTGEDVFVVHIEKAFFDVRGAYAIINQEFAAHFCKDVMYINREDDNGSEGLRKAKLSYRPVIILPKYSAHYRG